MNISVPEGHFQTQGWLSIILQTQTWDAACCLCVCVDLRVVCTGVCSLTSHSIFLLSAECWYRMWIGGSWCWLQGIVRLSQTPVLHTHLISAVPSLGHPAPETKAIIRPYVSARSCMATGHHGLHERCISMTSCQCWWTPKQTQESHSFQFV